MHRIDGPTRSADLPAPRPLGTGGASPGYFAHAGGGTSGTVVSSDWANAVQEEIAHVIEEAGFDLDKTDSNQLGAAIDLRIAAYLGGPDPTSVLDVNGYRIHPDGYIEQWGYVPGAITGENTGAITFPFVFPNACFGVSGTVINTGGVTGDTQIQEVSLATTGATVRFQSDQASSNDAGGGFRWRAWGH